MTSIDARSGTAALDHLTRAVGRAWTILRRVLVGALILGGAVILLELVHLHGLLAAVHPWLAHGVIGGLVLVTAAVIARFGYGGGRVEDYGADALIDHFEELPAALRRLATRAA